MPPVIPEIIEKPKEKLGVKRKPVNQNPAPPKVSSIFRHSFLVRKMGLIQLEC